MTSPNKNLPLRTFGRTTSRTLSNRRKGLMDTLYPRLTIPIDDRAPDTLDPKTLFPSTKETWLEIGFGGGEHLVQQAQIHSDVGLLGCEPFIDGMANALSEIDTHKIENIRLLCDDARKLMDCLIPGSIDRAFILFPDPWPKKKQQKRRIIQPDFLIKLARICRDGARIRFATDVRSYADEALEHFLANSTYHWPAENCGDWSQAPADHIRTRYETKNLGDIAPVWYDFIIKH